LRADRGKEK
jgi:hypothetical protein